MLRTSKIKINHKQFKEFAINKVYLTRHFENIYLLLLRQDYEQDIGDWNKLINFKIMRAVIRDNKGGKRYREDIEYIKEKYKDHQLMQDLIEVGQELKIHNLVMTMKKVKNDYKSYFSKLDNGKESNPPQPKKLSTMNSYTLKLDNSNSFSLFKKGENKLGITLDHNVGRQYLKVNHKQLTKLVDGDLDNIQTIDLQYSNGDLYILVMYHHQVKEIKDNKPNKIAGIDIGVNNLASIYIDDQNSPSLIVDGKKYKTYNAQFNRFIAKLSNTIDTLKNEDRDNEKKIKYLRKYKSHLFEKRNRFFFDQFHKVSKRILEYLDKHDVTELVIAKNLSRLKNDGGCNLQKKTKQNFIQIPFIKLLENLEYKAKDFGIKVIIVDESYTSKSNSCTDDIYKAHSLVNKIKELENKLEKAEGRQYYKLKSLINAYKKTLKKYSFQGRRIKRGLYIDEVNDKAYNADLNAARNIVKLSENYKKRKEKINYSKLCNPIKVKNDYEFCKLLKERWEYKIKKKVA